MNSTTSNLPRIIFHEVQDLSKKATIVMLFLILAFVLIALLGDKIHLACDPDYKRQIDQEQAENKSLDDKLRKIEQESKLRKP